jgi:putative SOS response-associated peptidase YedK
MCGRFTLTLDLEGLEERFDFRAKGLSYSPRYNVAPTQAVLSITRNGERGAHLMRWGLIPSWAKDPSIGNRMINARAETVAEKTSFKRALQKRRCLILADGFYEWKKDGKKKTPMYIALKSRQPFAFAGLWEMWKDPSGDAVRSCTIITTTPNSLMESIHNRMPVILTREAESNWLDGAIEDPKKLTSLLVPYPSDAMEAYAISTLVNSPANDTPDCIKPLR